MLLEVMVSLIIATLVIMSGLSLLMTASSGIDLALQNTIAANAARQVVENVRFYKGQTVPVGTYMDAQQFGAIPQLSNLNNGAASVYVVSWRPQVVQVAVTVRWNSGGRSLARSKTLSTLVTNDGVTP